MCMCMNVYISMYIRNLDVPNGQHTHDARNTRWRRVLGCLKLQVIFCRRAANSRGCLQKMTYQDKASCDSRPPCNKHVDSVLAHVKMLRKPFCPMWLARTCGLPITCLTYYICMSHWAYTCYFVDRYGTCVLHICNACILYLQCALRMQYVSRMCRAYVQGGEDS